MVHTPFIAHSLKSPTDHGFMKGFVSNAARLSYPIDTF